MSVQVTGAGSGSAEAAAVVRAALCASPYLAWALCVRCSPMLFVGADTTMPSYLFLVGLAVSLLVCVLGLSALTGRGESLTIRPLLVGAALCALVGTLLPLMARAPIVTVPIRVLYLLVGALVGMSYSCTCALFILGARQVGLRHALGGALVGSMTGIVLAVLACAMLPDDLLALCGLFPLLSAAFFWSGDGRRTDMSSSADERRIGRLGFGSNAHGSSQGPSGRLLALLFFIGFFAAFMPGMNPKSAHLPWMVSGVAYVGSMNTRSILYLAVYAALLAILWSSLPRSWGNAGQGETDGRRGAAVVCVAVVVVYAVMFFTLPAMKESPVSAALNTALSLLFAVLALSALGACVEGLARQRGLVAMASGACVAAVVTASLMGPLFGKVPYQDQVFVSLPFLVNIVVLVLGICEVPALVGLLHPVEAPVALDTLSLADRCGELARTYLLTPREADVLILVVQGRNEPYVADALGISRATVKTHVNHIYRKTNVASRQELLDLVRGEGKGRR